MKKLVFICFFFPAISYAGGPYFQHKDTTEQQEFELNYQDISTRVSSETVSSMISAAVSAATSSITGIELERSSFTVTAATATTATSFVNTNLTCTITLDSASNVVEFSATGMVDNNGSNNTYWTLARNGTNLASSTDGLGRATVGTANSFRYPWSIGVISDSPGVAGAYTYTVQIRVDGGSGGLCISGYCKGTCVEIKK